MAILVAGVVGSLGATSAAAQSGTGSYTSPVSGVEITTVEPWVFDPDLTEQGDGYEILGLNASFNSVLISFLPAVIDVQQAQGMLLDEFAAGFDGYQELDRGSYGTVTYSLDIANVSGTEFGVFSLFMGERASGFVEFSMFMAPAATFADGLDSVQASVTIDGTPIFDGVESAGLQDVLDANAGVTGGSSEPADVGEAGRAGGTAEPTEGATEEPAAEPTVATADDKDMTPVTVTDESDAGDDRDSRKLPGKDDSTPAAGNDSETGRGGKKLPTGDDELADYAELGIVSQGEYVSPQFETEILWDDTYAFDTSLEEPIVSDTREETDSLTLVWNGEDFVLLYVDIYASDGYTPADFEELWTSDDYLAETADPDAEVLLQDSTRTTGSVLIRDYLSDGEEILLLRQAISLDQGDTIAIVTLIGLPDSFSDAYADAGAGVTIDGAPALDVFTPREIERAR
jgi:hypothetical protein